MLVAWKIPPSRRAFPTQLPRHESAHCPKGALFVWCLPMQDKTSLQIARAHVREALVAAQRVMLVKAIQERKGVLEAEALLRNLEESLAGYRRVLVMLE